VLHQILKSS